MHHGVTNAELKSGAKSWTSRARIPSSWTVRNVPGHIPYYFTYCFLLVLHLLLYAVSLRIYFNTLGDLFLYYTPPYIPVRRALLRSILLSSVRLTTCGSTTDYLLLVLLRLTTYCSTTSGSTTSSSTTYWLYYLLLVVLLLTTTGSTTYWLGLGLGLGLVLLLTGSTTDYSLLVPLTTRTTKTYYFTYCF